MSLIEFDLNQMSVGQCSYYLDFQDVLVGVWLLFLGNLPWSPPGWLRNRGTTFVSVIRSFRTCFCAESLGAPPFLLCGWLSPWVQPHSQMGRHWPLWSPRTTPGPQANCCWPLWSLPSPDTGLRPCCPLSWHIVLSELTCCVFLAGWLLRLFWPLGVDCFLQVWLVICLQYWRWYRPEAMWSL